jgi:hypothetical protein
MGVSSIASHNYPDGSLLDLKNLIKIIVMGTKDDFICHNNISPWRMSSQ